MIKLCRQILRGNEDPRILKIQGKWVISQAWFRVHIKQIGERLPILQRSGLEKVLASPVDHISCYPVAHSLGTHLLKLMFALNWCNIHLLCSHLFPFQYRYLCYYIHCVLYWICLTCVLKLQGSTEFSWSVCRDFGDFNDGLIGGGIMR